MDFPCPICSKTFAEPGDRTRHIKTKQDNNHREHYRKQMETQAARMTKTVNRITQVLPSAPSHADLQASDAYNMDVDEDSSESDVSALAMDVDNEDGNDCDSESDVDGSLVSLPFDTIDQDMADEDFQSDPELARTLEEASHYMDLESMECQFNFLPYPATTPGPLATPSESSTSSGLDSDFSEEEPEAGSGYNSDSDSLFSVEENQAQESVLSNLTEETKTNSGTSPR
ncbi:hypothetical protein D9757_014336 [Collybiopsis confluens]|nr:hypothetical protein D9757_014336 [Collybiopsis confluens]